MNLTPDALMAINARLGYSHSQYSVDIVSIQQFAGTLTVFFNCTPKYENRQLAPLARIAVFKAHEQTGQLYCDHEIIAAHLPRRPMPACDECGLSPCGCGDQERSAPVSR